MKTKRTLLQAVGIVPTVDDRPTVAEFNARELATVLAALRYWQDRRPCFEHLDSIATDGGTLKELNRAEIDDLCGRLNR